MQEQCKEIVVVDDDVSMGEAIRRLLSAAGLPVKVFRSAESFLETGITQNTACLVLDVHLPGLSGFELNQQLVQSGTKLPVVFITAHDELISREKAEEAGALAYLTKPFPGRRLLAALLEPSNGTGLSDRVTLPRPLGS